MAGIVTDEAANNPKRGFVGGYYDAAAIARAVLPGSTFLSPRAWGRCDFAQIMEQYDHYGLAMWLMGEDLPRESNRVTLNRACA